MMQQRSKQHTQRKLRIEDLHTFDPLTENQVLARQEWAEGHNLVHNGSAGTGHHLKNFQ